VATKFEKIQNEQKWKLKCEVLTQLAASIHSIMVDTSDGDEPWVEIIDDKQYELLKIENVTSFGILHLSYRNKFNHDDKITLSLELKRSGN